jgi:hypothetical protein
MDSNDNNCEVNEESDLNNCKKESNESEVGLSLDELSQKNEELLNQNSFLRRDLKRKEKIITLLIQKLRSNLESTRLTIDNYERQLLNHTFNDADNEEAILPQDFLDFEMNQDFNSSASNCSSAAVTIEDDDDDWSPTRTKPTKEGFHFFFILEIL